MIFDQVPGYSLIRPSRSTMDPKGSPTANLIGARVRWMRERLQLTQDQLAGRLARHGIHLDYVKIGQIEKGKRRVIDKELVAFAKALGVSITWLLSGDEDHF